MFQHDAKNETILNPTGLKNLIRKKFYPTMQHDSHEFFMHVLSQLQDEETPKMLEKFNSEVTKENKNRSMAEIYR